MFILRPEHEAAFDADYFRRFQIRAAGQMRRFHGTRLASLSDADLRALVGRGCEQARAYGLRSERQLVRFLHCVVYLDDLLMPNSPHTVVVNVLADFGRSPEDRSVEALRLVEERRRVNV